MIELKSLTLVWSWCVSKSTEFAGKSLFSGKTGTVSCFITAFFRGMHFPWRVRDNGIKTGRDWAKGGVILFENLPHRCLPLHFKTMALKLFYVLVTLEEQQAKRPCMQDPVRGLKTSYSATWRIHLIPTGLNFHILKWGGWVRWSYFKDRTNSYPYF